MKKTLQNSLIVLGMLFVQQTLLAQNLSTTDSLKISTVEVSHSSDTLLTPQEREQAIHELILRFKVLNKEVVKLANERDTIFKNNINLSLELNNQKKATKKEQEATVKEKKKHKWFFGSGVASTLLVLLILL